MSVASFVRRGTLLGLAVGASLAVTAVVYAAVQWGPQRPTFTWAKPATYVTFNSIVDNPDPSIGDERFFVSARDAASSDTLTYTKNLTVKDNQEVLVRVFFHNNAAKDLNLVATNTKLKVVLPAGQSTNPQAVGYISADNANPKEVWSTMDFKGDKPFSMQYVSGSAQLWTQYVTGVKVSDDIVTSGAVIGTKGTDGKVPGCAEFSGFVTFKVKIKMEQPPVPPKVKFACTALDVTKVDRTKFDFTARASVENATVKSYVFTTKNSGGSTVDTTTVTTNALSAVYHFNQSTAGTYTVNAVVNTDKGSTGVTNVCTKQVTVEAPPVVQGGVTPPPAQQPLPKTGAAGVAGLFAGASALGTAGHYLFRRYRG